MVSACKWWRLAMKAIFFFYAFSSYEEEGESGRGRKRRRGKKYVQMWT